MQTHKKQASAVNVYSNGNTESSGGISRPAVPVLQKIEDEEIEQKQYPEQRPAVSLLPRTTQLAAARFLTDDGEPVTEGKVSKNNFLDSLRSRAGALAKQILEPMGLAQKDCPDLEYWIGYYQSKDAAFTEQAVKRYAPAAAHASNHSELLDLLMARVSEGLIKHRETGSTVVEPGEAPPGVLERRPSFSTLTIQKKATDPIQFDLCSNNALGQVAVMPTANSAQIALEANGSAAGVNRLYAAGATGNEITTMLNIEHDSQVLLAQIMTEANQNAKGIHDLYTVGASSSQITTLLTRENNSGMLHYLINRETSRSAVGILQLYLAGAGSKDIDNMLTIERDSQVVLGLIAREANNSAKNIGDLYRLPVSTSDIRDLMLHCTNGQVLEALVTREISKSVPNILQLFRDGVAPGKMAAMLLHERDAAELHNRVQADPSVVDTMSAAVLTTLQDPTPVDPRFTPTTLLYGSREGGKFGSIYFNVGRIRLTHSHNPTIEIQPGNINRFTISNADANLYEQWKKTTRPKPLIPARFIYVTKLSSCRQAAPGSGDKLIEFFGAGGSDGMHPSRGGPANLPVTLNQNHINILYNAAALKNNNMLKLAMLADPSLAQIPIN